MADITITVASPAPIDQLSESDQDILHTNPEFKPNKESRFAEVESEREGGTVDTEPELKPEVIIEGYKEVERRVEGYLGVIQERARDLIMPIDRAAKPDLYRCANELYGAPEPVTAITFDMYLQALRYIKDVGLEIGRSS